VHESNNPGKSKKKVSATTGKTGGKNGFQDYNFVRYTPTPQDKQAIAKAGLSEATAITELLGALQDGYKLSCTFDQKNGTFVASLTLMMIHHQTTRAFLLVEVLTQPALLSGCATYTSFDLSEFGLLMTWADGT